MDVDLDVRGIRDAADVVVRPAERLDRPQPAFDRMFRVLEQGEREVFSSRGGAIGSAWAAIRKPRPGKGPLRDTDRLYNSLTGRTGDSVRKVTGTTARFGTRVPYAPILAKRRPMVGAPAKTRRDVADELADYLMGR